MLSIDRASLLHAFKIALSAVLAYWLALAFHCDTPYWAPINAFAVTCLSQSALWQKGIMRVSGAIVGCALSFLIMPLFVEHPLLFTVFAMAITTLGFYLMQKAKYGFFWCFVLIHVVMISTVGMLHPAETFDLALNRSFAVTVGVLTAWLVQCGVWPISSARSTSSMPSSLWPVSMPTLLHSMQVALAIGIALWLWQWLKIPGGALNMAIAIVTVLQPELNKTTHKGLQRFLGCVVGVTLGLIVIGIGVEQLPVMLLLLVVLGTLAMYGFLHPGWTCQYFSLQAIVGYCITALPKLQPAQTIEPGVERAVGILFGVIVAVVVIQVSGWGIRMFKARA